MPAGPSILRENCQINSLVVLCRIAAFLVILLSSTGAQTLLSAFPCSVVFAKTHRSCGFLRFPTFSLKQISGTHVPTVCFYVAVISILRDPPGDIRNSDTVLRVYKQGQA